MAKTIVSMLIGIAIDEGRIHSVDDLAETYVPELAGTAFGQTSLRALLHMASGVGFREDYVDPSADNFSLNRMLFGQSGFDAAHGRGVPGDLGARRLLAERLEVRPHR